MSLLETVNGAEGGFNDPRDSSAIDRGCNAVFVSWSHKNPGEDCDVTAVHPFE
ncbi:hypothetical protein PROFUN_09891 [Planoprotostelium fungivorum]|uniref:Uncharacterized protein n=1 Tax=Planoprotostelium fungivorum TaxID=1890364 RepID=A0A2P6NGE5_9EUKA|nr:hypothetical protein PROFUN_09891 [Planoprotostelium fungivorum]